MRNRFFNLIMMLVILVSMIFSTGLLNLVFSLGSEVENVRKWENP